MSKKNDYALRIYNGNELKAVLTTRTSLILEDGQVKNDLSVHGGLNAVLYNITEQKEESKFMIPLPTVEPTTNEETEE